MVMAFDPGIRVAGLAVFGSSRLVYATVVRSPELTERGPVAWLAMSKAVKQKLLDAGFPWLHEVVVERMMVYRKQIGDPDNLLNLEGINGAVVATVDADAYYGYLARIWKKSLQKDYNLDLIESLLSPEELACIEDMPASIRHNAIDAIGLGLYHIGRLTPQLRRPRGPAFDLASTIARRAEADYDDRKDPDPVG